MSTTHAEREATQRAYDEDEDQENDFMPHRYADAHSAGSDREISLGTGTILAVFFALVLVCSVFFGFGYTIGHKSVGPSTVAASAVPTHSLSDAFKSFKPAPGGPVAAASPVAVSPDAEDASTTTSHTTVVLPTTVVAANSTKTVAPVAVASSKKPFDPDAEIVTSSTPAPTAKSAASTHPAPALRPSPADISQASPAPIGTAIVQVAAVSHQEDADTMIAALKRKGYTVAVHHEPQDKLLHIQLGPYPTKKDAEAMRQRLQGDGFNSILK